MITERDLDRFETEAELIVQQVLKKNMEFFLADRLEMMQNAGRNPENTEGNIAGDTEGPVNEEVSY